MSMAINFCRVVIYNEEFPSLKHSLSSPLQIGEYGVFKILNNEGVEKISILLGKPYGWGRSKNGR